ncbi:MAG: helix-turn-helix transcriptional regulator [Pyrinomonadaceae bacterium]
MKSEAIQKLSAQIARLLSEIEPEQQTAPAAPPLLIARDVAARLQINTQAVYRLEREGKLPAVLLGQRTKRWTEDVVSEFIKQGGIVEQKGHAPAKRLRVLHGNG